MIEELRVIKSLAEIELMRKAGRIGVKAHIEMMKATRPGITCEEVNEKIKYFLKKKGYDLSKDVFKIMTRRG